MRRRILVVDDDEDIRRLVTVALDEHYEVETAPDGKAALAKLANRAMDFHAVVLDLAMPGMSGFEVLEKLRADADTDALPVLVLTARTDRDARMDAFVGGGHVFVTKPFDPDELRVRLQKLLQTSHSARQAGRLEQLLDLPD